MKIMVVSPISRFMSSKSSHLFIGSCHNWSGLIKNTCIYNDISQKMHRFTRRAHLFTFLKPKNNIQKVSGNWFSTKTGLRDLLDYSKSISEEEKDEIIKNMQIIESFLSDNEEKSLLGEIEPYMRRLRYEFNHWDNAIHGFRETERAQWNEENTKILNRLRDHAFPPGTPQLHHVHVLDLAEEGHIKPHIDSIRFCGNTIAGLSLLTDAVMRLVHEKDKTKTVDVLLKRKSLYIMRDSVRYDFTHEILTNDESKFKDEKVAKGRRLSIICRNEPNN